MGLYFTLVNIKYFTVFNIGLQFGIIETRSDIMAKDTNVSLRSLNIYQVFLRQHTEEGTFLSLIKDLPRIKTLGMDYVYLLPIHPIGVLQRKGSVGSPYSIKDYRGINKDYGTEEDFVKLIKSANEEGLKIMIDVVFNHTSHDAVLLEEHPEWYFRRDGKLAGKVGDWWDITDLDFSHRGLWDYLIETLVKWAKLGVDGFRCDVAPMVPQAFWLEAREAVKKVNPNVIWLSETMHGEFVKYIRDSGFDAMSDSETYEAFDICYDYDIHHDFLGYVEGRVPLNDWLKAILRQDYIFPKNYVKLRNLENHDQERIAHHVKDPLKLLNLTGTLFFLKGATMIYAGQEYGVTKRPDLFEVDKVDFSIKNTDIRNLIHRMSHLKKDSLFQTGVFNIHLQSIEAAVISFENKQSMTYGIFNLGQVSGEVEVTLPDGIYQNILYPNQVEVKHGKLKLTDKPMVLFGLKQTL